ncbi:2-amino-4-hydroxy-6-hydroxymethyldihydropteridine diphosphokinase [Shigella flexneri]
MTVAYIAIGSNLASPLEAGRCFLESIRRYCRKPHSAVSSFLPHPPLGRNEPDYLNAAVALETTLAPGRATRSPHNVSNCSKVASVKLNAGTAQALGSGHHAVW